MFFKGIQAQYIYWQVEGGTPYPARRAIPVPCGVRLNKFGNMPRRKLQTLLSKRNAFSGNVKGVAGLYERRRHRDVKLLMAYKSSVRYRRRFPFDRIVQRYVIRRIDRELEKAFHEAVDGAR